MRLRFPLQYPDDPASAAGDTTATSTPAEQPTLPTPEASSDPAAGNAPGFAATGPTVTTEGIASPHATAYAGFDPDKHRVGPDGKPVMTPTGRYAKKVGSRNNAPGVSTSRNANATGVVGVKADHLPIAKQTVNILIGTCVRVFGPEWEPVDKEEPQTLAFAFRDYFDARGVPQLPPEIVLIMAIGAYALPRMNQPHTKSKLAQIFMRVREWRDSLKRGKK